MIVITMDATPHTPQVRFSQETPIDSSTSNSGQRKTPFRSRRFTPYQKTPKSRTIKGTTTSTQARSPRTITSEIVLKEITNKTWKLYRVSPLCKFSHNTADIKLYSRLLSAFIEAESAKGTAISTDYDAVDKATFSVVKGLKGMCDSTADSVQIVLKKKMATGKREGESCVMLTAILCCVQHTPDAINYVDKAFTLLPLMLVKGPVGLTQHLQTWLKITDRVLTTHNLKLPSLHIKEYLFGIISQLGLLKMTFDCAISPLKLTPVQLNWTIALWAGELLDKKTKPVQLMYKTPRDIEGINKITLDVDPRDCKKLWDSIHNSDNEEVHENEVKCFVKALEAHFYYHFKISLYAMPLLTVGTGVVYVSSEGRLKIFSANHVGQVLAHLTDLTLEQRISL